MGKSTAVRLAVLEEQILSQREATKLQATEYQRRLDELNHAHAQAAARNANYIGREVFEAKVEQLHARIASIGRLVYVGTGIVLALNALLYFFFKGPS